VARERVVVGKGGRAWKEAVTPGDREVASIENSSTVTDTVLKGGDLVGGATVARAPVVSRRFTKYDQGSVQSLTSLSA
jgi:hypothetical protein